MQQLHPPYSCSLLHQREQRPLPCLPFTWLALSMPGSAKTFCSPVLPVRCRCTCSPLACWASLGCSHSRWGASALGEGRAPLQQTPRPLHPLHPALPPHTVSPSKAASKTHPSKTVVLVTCCSLLRSSSYARLLRRQKLHPYSTRERDTRQQVRSTLLTHAGLSSDVRQATLALRTGCHWLFKVRNCVDTCTCTRVACPVFHTRRHSPCAQGTFLQSAASRQRAGSRPPRCWRWVLCCQLQVATAGVQE